jgi:hypothetical protein
VNLPWQRGVFAKKSRRQIRPSYWKNGVSGGSIQLAVAWYGGQEKLMRPTKGDKGKEARRLGDNPGKPGGKNKRMKNKRANPKAKRED